VYPIYIIRVCITHSTLIVMLHWHVHTYRSMENAYIMAIAKCNTRYIAHSTRWMRMHRASVAIWAYLINVCQYHWYPHHYCPIIHANSATTMGITYSNWLKYKKERNGIYDRDHTYANSNIRIRWLFIFTCIVISDGQQRINEVFHWILCYLSLIPIVISF